MALSSHRVCIFALFAQKLARVCLEHGEQPNKIRAKLFAAILKQRIRWDFLCPHQTAANHELATERRNNGDQRFVLQSLIHQHNRPEKTEMEGAYAA